MIVATMLNSASIVYRFNDAVFSSVRRGMRGRVRFRMHVPCRLNFVYSCNIQVAQQTAIGPIVHMNLFVKVLLAG